MTTASELTGAGGTTGAALTAIGSDLSVSITFQVAAELLDAASEKQLSEEVLVGLVLGLAVVFSALRSLLRDSIARRRKEFKASSDAAALKMAEQRGLSESAKVELIEQCALDTNAKLAERGALEFAEVLIDIVVRISFGVSVQLLASSARARQTSRAARVLSLSGLGLYFLWCAPITINLVLRSRGRGIY
tara:strand:- start:1213 stop:1785 length:573 start_codon:yes stop_codon:yes gene_type:complete